MTEEIIVDGVNIAECEHIAIQDGYIGCTNNENGECEKCFCAFKKRYGETPQTIRLDNFYKSSALILQEELQRLKQENEALRYKIQEAVQANDRIVAECAEIIKPKCEPSITSELMQENAKLKERIKELKQSEDNFYNKAEKAHKKYYKCKQALEEIKEIVIKATDISYSIEVNSMLYDIKDKINECIGG